MNNFLQNTIGYHLGGSLATISFLSIAKGYAELFLIFCSAAGILINAYVNFKNRKK